MKRAAFRFGSALRAFCAGPLWRAPALVAVLVAVLAAGAPAARADSAVAGGIPVDLELILAVDVSGSMDDIESQLQREGYLRALTNPRVIKAIRGGEHGRIAMIYMEWAGPHWQKVVADWTMVHDAQSAQAFATVIAEEPVITERRTSISTAIDVAMTLFAKSPYKGTRRVIDISGDGPNNRGRPLPPARAEALAQGITINGLPIINDRMNPFGGPPPRDLDLYYQDWVIGGPGAFIVAATGFENFYQALLSKLIREISALPAERGVNEARALPHAPAGGGTD